MNFKIVKTLFFYQLLFSLLIYGVFANAEENTVGATVNVGTVNAVPESENNRIAPGEFLPISIKLVNFGSQKRVDIIIDYKILDSSNEEVYSESETVAVETTANFVKRIQLPYTIKPGLYTVVSSLKYPYQEGPATSKFPILVEEKTAGFFKSDLVFYSIVFILIILTAVILTYLFASWSRKHRIIVHDYNDKPKDQIIYYEILSDIISQMRLRVGNDALEIAKNIPDLEINDKNGLVINIKKDPAKIIALLIFRYEKLFGRQISFGLRQK